MYGSRLTIRSVLNLLVLACLVPTALMASALIYQSFQRERQQLVRDSLGTARAMTLAVDRDLASAEAALGALATSPYLTSGNLAAFYEQAQEILKTQVANNVVLSDRTGQQRLNTLRPFGEPLPRHGNQQQLHRIFETGKPAVSDMYVGAVTRKPLVGIDVPVFRGGAVVYDLSMGLFPERLSKILSEQRLPPNWVAAIFDGTGTIVARTHGAEQYVGRKGAPAVVKRMSEVAEDSVETETVEGTPALIVFSRSSVSHWTVAIGIPRAELSRQLRQSLWKMLVALAVLLAVSLWLARILGERVVRALRGLNQPALTLGYGEPVSVPPLGLREADEVGYAIEKASATLRQARYSAQHDPLTGLANRVLFDEIVNRQLSLCQRTRSQLSLLYVDLDDFKQINDRYGHDVGDELLRAVSARIKSGIRESDIAARLGGDEFAVALNNTGTQDAAAVAAKLVDTVSSPYPIDSLTLEISASIGIAGYPDTANSAELLLHHADKAMYQAKTGGKRRYTVAAH